MNSSEHTLHALLQEAQKNYETATPQRDALRELEAACEIAATILE